MSHAVAVLATIIFTTILIAHASMDADKKSVETGYVILDHRAFRLQPCP